jgi:hydroxymethylglutaryl-CoA lyase
MTGQQRYPAKVEIREVGPREGFQSYHAVVPTESKVALIEALAASGIAEIEVTSFVRPDKVPQLADAEALVATLSPHAGVRYTALYLNTTGFKRAEASTNITNRGWLYTSPSQTFLKANSNTTIEDALAKVPEWCGLFKDHGKEVFGLMVSNAFGCAYEGTVATQKVVELVTRYQEAISKSKQTLREVCLADTVGMGNPMLIESALRALAPLKIPVSLHLHDTRGLGLVNAYAGICNGVTVFESSVGGIGGCPFTPGASGNIATEDLVYLCHSLGVETGIDLNALSRAAHLAESIMGGPLPGRVYKTYPR